MSNELAIATVTETFRFLLNAPVEDSVPSALATAVRPEEVPAGPAVNIFLYQVSPNPSWRNEDLPFRSGDGNTLVRRPQAALDLHYLLTFHGSDANLEPQRLLGTVARVIHSRPVLDRDTVRLAVSGKPVLAGSDLADQVDLVRISPMPLTLEELTKLWSVFLQTKYVLSAVFQASVVLIEGTEAPRSPLPVRERRVVVLPGIRPMLERVGGQTGTNDVFFDAPVLDDERLHLIGTGLRGGTTTRVRIGQSVLAPASVDDRRVIVDLATELPVAEQRAGVKVVQVVLDVNFGTPADPHRGFESNAVPFMLSPRLTAAPSFAGGEVTVDVSPPIEAGQRAVLMLNGAESFSFPAVVGAATSSISIPIPGVPAGNYLVRLQVDGATSRLETNPGGQYVGPTVTVP